jgi:hypothetical protein
MKGTLVVMCAATLAAACAAPVEKTSSAAQAVGSGFGIYVAGVADAELAALVGAPSIVPNQPWLDTSSVNLSSAFSARCRQTYGPDYGGIFQQVGDNVADGLCAPGPTVTIGINTGTPQAALAIAAGCDGGPFGEAKWEQCAEAAHRYCVQSWPEKPARYEIGMVESYGDNAHGTAAVVIHCAEGLLIDDVDLGDPRYGGGFCSTALAGNDSARCESVASSICRSSIVGLVGRDADGGVHGPLAGNGQGGVLLEHGPNNHALIGCLF